MEPEKYNELVDIAEKKLTHRYREQTSGYQWGEGGGKGAAYKLGSKRYKLLGIK